MGRGAATSTDQMVRCLEMTTSSNNLKRRWWQFNLRTFLLLMALVGVLLAGFSRCRQWGEELQAERIKMGSPAANLHGDSIWVPGVSRRIEAGLNMKQEWSQFESKYWFR